MVYIISHSLTRIFVSLSNITQNPFAQYNAIGIMKLNYLVIGYISF